MAWHDDIQNKYVQAYLAYVEDTESPRIFHIWTAISAIGACLERRAKFPFGIDEIYPNTYVALVGPPATRKSTAARIASKLLKSSTALRFAPDDTSGQRQGLISAMEGGEGELDGESMNGHEADIAAALDACDLDAIGDIKIKVSAVDRHVMYAVCNELTSLLGENSKQMLTFLINAYDGVDYKYKLRREEAVLKDPLLSILGATTPTQIISSLPPEAIGQGFMSRLILVYANAKHKSIYRPSELSEVRGNKLKEIYSDLYYKFEGDFKITDEADQLLKWLYDHYTTKMNDSRFVFYEERRQVHLLKVSMCLAASRLSYLITVQDLQDAHKILCYTEQFMPEALGEFGMSPIAAAKHKMLEYLQHCRVPIPQAVLWSFMHRDMRTMDFMNALQDMVNSGKIVQITDKVSKQTAYVYKDKRPDVDALLQGLFEEEDESDAVNA